MKHYLDYLPDYLGGKNIEAHSALMDSMNLTANELVDVLSLWCNFKRPILIQWEAKSMTDIMMTVHIHVHSPIKSITVSGAYNYTKEYNIEDLVEDDTISFRVNGHPDYIVMPKLTVRVETYDEVVYEKAYPENDKAKGNLNDHDEFLDKIGRLVGIPRRIYKGYKLDEGYLAEPPYFGKINGDNMAVLSCTEDDYYYSKRIEYYLENFNKISLPVLLLQVLYGYTEVTELNTAMINESSGVWDYIADTDTYIEGANKAGTYIFLVNKRNPVNIDSLSEEDKVLFVEKYIPITRVAYIFAQLDTNISIHDFVYPRSYSHLFDATIRDVYDNPLEARDCMWSVDDMNPVSHTLTNHDGVTGSVFNGIPMGYHSVTARHVSGLGYEGSTDSKSYKSYLDVMQNMMDYTFTEGDMKIPLFTLYPWSNSKDYMYWIKCSGDPSSYHIRFEYNDGQHSRYCIVEPWLDNTLYFIPSEYRVYRYGDGMQYDEFAPSDEPFGNGVQVYLVGETEDTVSVQIWVTDYKPYHEQNVLNEEFTLRYHVDIPLDAEEYPFSIVSDGRVFTVDLLNYNATSGRNTLEYKFINYECHLFVNDMDTLLVCDWDTYTLHDENGEDTPLPTVGAGVNHNYALNPRASNVTEEYLLPITNLSSIPVHREDIKSSMKFIISPAYYDMTCLELLEYTGEDRLFPVGLELADEYDNGLNAEVTIKRRVGTDTTEYTAEVTGGVAEDIMVAGRDTRGQVNYIAEYEGGWRRQNTLALASLMIRSNPTMLTCTFTDENGNSNIYAHPTLTMNVNIHLEARPLNDYIGEHPLRFVGDSDVIITIAEKQYTVHTDSNGDATLTIPIGVRVDTFPVQIRYMGSDRYASCSLDTQYIVLMNEPHIEVLNDMIYPSDEPFTINVKVTDNYDMPVGNRMIQLSPSSLNAYRTTTDSSGFASITIPYSEVTRSPWSLWLLMSQSTYMAMSKLQLHAEFASAENPMTPVLKITSDASYYQTGTDNALLGYVQSSTGNNRVWDGYVRLRFNDTYIRDDDGRVATVDLSETKGYINIPFSIAKWQPFTVLNRQRSGHYNLTLEYISNQDYLQDTSKLTHTTMEVVSGSAMKQSNTRILSHHPSLADNHTKETLSTNTKYNTRGSFKVVNGVFYQDDRWLADTKTISYDNEGNPDTIMPYDIIYYYPTSNQYISLRGNKYWRHNQNTTQIPLSHYVNSPGASGIPRTTQDIQGANYQILRYGAGVQKQDTTPLPSDEDIIIYTIQNEIIDIATTKDEINTLTLQTNLFNDTLTTMEYQDTTLQCHLTLRNYTTQLPEGTALPNATINIDAYNENGDSVHITTLTTGDGTEGTTYGQADTTINLADIQLTGYHITLHATYTDPTTEEVTASTVKTIHITDSAPQSNITITKVGSITAANRLPYTTYTVEAVLTDLSTNAPITNQPLVFTLPNGTTQTVNTDNTGYASLNYQPSTNDMDTNHRLNVQVNYAGQVIDEQVIHSPATKSDYWTVTSDEPMITTLTQTVTAGSINASQLSTTSIPVSVHLATNDAGLPTQHIIENASIGIYYYNGDAESLIQTLTTDNTGNASTTLTGLTAGASTNIEIRAKYLGEGTTYQASNDTENITLIEDRLLNTSITIAKTTPSTARNKLPYCTYTATATLQDSNNTTLSNKTVVFTLPDGSTQSATTNNIGKAAVTFQPRIQDIVNNRLTIYADYAGQAWDGTSGYNSCTKSAYWTITADEAFTTELSATTTYPSDTIAVEDLPSVQIPVSVSLQTNDSSVTTQHRVAQQSVKLYYYDRTNETLLQTITTDNNGTASTTINGLTTTTASNIQIRAKFEATTDYTASNASINFHVTQPTPVATDPLDDSLLFDINNWGTFPSASSGSGQTGTPTAATTSDLMIDATAKTITDQNQKYMVYNKTLQDFFDYYGDTFSLIAYKTGGDGRYQLGFVNTTTNGYKLGYIDGSAVNNEASSSTSLGEVLYQNYNEFTFERNGTDITLYWKQGGANYKSKTMPLGTVDPTKYYLYFRSTIRAGITFTNDTSKIQNHSRQQ